MVNLHQKFCGKRVWISGHTGFKGSWLTELLLGLGAHVHGYALPSETSPSLFNQLSLYNRVEHEISDIRNTALVKKSITSFRPDFLIHMAAQPLVRRSYTIPVETYETNVFGTINVLEALRELKTPCVAIIVTTDKVYNNLESGRAYEEDDALGGYDPYSSSKAMAEIATSAYRNSYFSSGLVRIASARAGNVIGGGDWAEDRIVPDAMRALNQGKPVLIRNATAVRPWQHVLEPLSGYLSLAAEVANNPTLASAFNFGPDSDSCRTVLDLVERILIHRKGSYTNSSQVNVLHEAKLLDLSIAKTTKLLNWRPRWKFDETVRKTSTWYQEVYENKSTPIEVTTRQINEYLLT